VLPTRVGGTFGWRFVLPTRVGGTFGWWFVLPLVDRGTFGLVKIPSLVTPSYTVGVDCMGQALLPSGEACLVSKPNPLRFIDCNAKAKKAQQQIGRRIVRILIDIA